MTFVMSRRTLPCVRYATNYAIIIRYPKRVATPGKNILYQILSLSNEIERLDIISRHAVILRRLTYLFDNNATVLFAVVMSFWSKFQLYSLNY